MPSFVPSQPLYVAVADKLEKLIRAGTLRPGERIPSVRRTCAQHSVSLTTSVQAYLLLENRGLIEARPKSGFFVRLQFAKPRAGAAAFTSGTDGFTGDGRLVAVTDF